MFVIVKRLDDFRTMKVIFKMWLKYKKKFRKKTLWIVPAEVIKPFSKQDWLKYKDLVLMESENIKLKTEEDLTFKYG